MLTSRHLFGVLVVLAATGLSARADQLRGIVQSTDAEARKIVVKEDGTDRQVDVTVPEEATLTTVLGKVLLLKDIRKGDGVGVAHRDGVATRILVTKAPLVGVVSSTDADRMRIVVTTSDPTADVEVTTAAKTTFESVGGAVLKLKDLKPGDGVSVNYDGPDVVKVVINPKAPELIGHVKSVAADLKSIVVTEVGSGADTTVTINDKTTIVTNEGKAMEVKDLKKGDGVGIAHDKGLASKIVVNVRQP